jgi:CDP-diacylglycerol--serine O-phosphatidyltransferase
MSVKNPERPKRRFMKQRFPERFRKQKLKPQSLTGMIPNMTTILAMCFGMTAVRFAFTEKWELAVISILIAGLCDALDGSLARLLKSTSRLGAELDSLSDLLNFGAAPALVLYMKSLAAWGDIGWVISLFFTACMALRLARFNVLSSEPKPQWSQGFFIGVPAPAAAFLGLQPLIFHFAFPSCEWFISPFCTSIFMLVSGALMVSRIPTFSIKTLKIQPHQVLPLMLFLMLIVGCLYSFVWHTLCVIAIVYVSLIPFSIRCYALKKTDDSTALQNIQVSS